MKDCQQCGTPFQPKPNNPSRQIYCGVRCKWKSNYYRNKTARRKNERTRYAKNPTKYKARSAVRHAVKTGTLKKEPCAVCGTKESVHGHHEDYSKPLEVLWLCKKHHYERHREIDG